MYLQRDLNLLATTCTYLVWPSMNALGTRAALKTRSDGTGSLKRRGEYVWEDG